MATGDQKTCNLQNGKTPAQKAKQVAADRLSKALRDNLHRRKAQARARKSTDTAADKAGEPNKDGRWVFMKLGRRIRGKKGYSNPWMV